MGARNAERRRHPRAATSLSAEIVVDGRRCPTRVINLSLGGALLDFRGTGERPTIAPGERVSVQIHCRAIEAHFAIEANAVLWNTALGPEPLLALQFDEVSGEPADVLEELMAEALVDLRRLKIHAQIP
jgi:hypothetical protein